MSERREEEENSCICAVNSNEGERMEVGEQICLGCPKVTFSSWLTLYQLLLEHLRIVKPVNTMVLVDIWGNSGPLELALLEAVSSMWGQTGQLQGKGWCRPSTLMFVVVIQSTLAADLRHCNKGRCGVDVVCCQQISCFAQQGFPARREEQR